MEIKRDIYQKIIEWKNETNGSKALLIEGARRIGKSTVVEEIGKNEYKSYILIDFNKAPKKIKDAFDDLNDLDLFFQTLSLQYNKKLFIRESLIIFDEIQKFPKAREAIKYLVQDGRYDYIETGSLISIRENIKDITIPSEERKIRMYPVSFKEYMYYMDQEILYKYIEECFNNQKPLAREYHEKAMNLFKEYMLIGGMPQALVAYRNSNKNFEKADIEKRDILNLYRDDIRKAEKKYKLRVSAIFENIPAYLSTHEKRIVLNEIEKDGRFKNYDDPLFWLDDSMICNLSYKCNDPNIGLSLNKNESYVKCYMADTGLLVSLAFNENELATQELYKEIINDKLSINEGMLYENVISQILVSHNKKLFFYTRYSLEKHRNDIEIDFILSNESKTKYKINPIEVKSSKNYSTTSLDKFNDIFKKRINSKIIIHPKNYMVTDGIIKIPPYMIDALLKNNQ